MIFSFFAAIWCYIARSYNYLQTKWVQVGSLLLFYLLLLLRRWKMSLECPFSGRLFSDVVCNLVDANKHPGIKSIPFWVGYSVESEDIGICKETKKAWQIIGNLNPPKAVSIKNQSGPDLGSVTPGSTCCAGPPCKRKKSFSTGVCFSVKIR